jgi:hypothetical protein
MRPYHQKPTFGRKPNLVERQRLRALYEQGLSCEEIASRLGCQASNVYVKLRRSGMKMRSASEGAALKRRRNERRALIAQAAQRKFGYQVAPEPEPQAPQLPPVNEPFADDDVPDFSAWGDL